MREHQHIKSDGSRIEASHKYWNTVTRGVPSNVENFISLGHDFVHRRNTRISYELSANDDFIGSSYGSHHHHLCNDVAKTWNRLLVVVQSLNGLNKDLTKMPELPLVESNERFGLVGASLAAVEGLKLEDIELADEMFLAAESAVPDDMLSETVRDIDLGPLINTSGQPLNTSQTRTAQVQQLEGQSSMNTELPAGHERRVVEIINVDAEPNVSSAIHGSIDLGPTEHRLEPTADMTADVSEHQPLAGIMSASCSQSVLSRSEAIEGDHDVVLLSGKSAATTETKVTIVRTISLLSWHVC